MLNQIKHSEITLKRCRSGAVSGTATASETATASVSGTARRAGITIIEVLTAMVVAMIGVFGVMILIPFAVRQAQVGLDLDHANRLAKNGIAHFEMAGMQIPTRWQDGVGTPVDPTNVRANVLVAAIDPLQVPFLDPNGFTQDPRVAIPQLTLSYPDPLAPSGSSPYDVGMARAMFRTSDDLQFGDRISELGPPQQIFDSFAGANVRRQFRGAMSWMSIVAPYGVVSGEPTNTFRMYTLVYKDRVLDPALVEMDIRAVQLPGTNTTGIAYSGGTIEVTDPLPFDDARKGDWVMLFTTRPNTPPTSFGEVDIGFFKIASVPSGNFLTLDGADFRFSNGTTAQIVHAVLLVGFQSGTLGTSQPPKRLDHVVNVYERTFNTEHASSWNR